jgi:hypothetical protein
MAEPGIPQETCASQLRAFQQRRMIHPVAQRGSGRTAHNLYSYSELGIAKIASLLTTDHSIADNAIQSSMAGQLSAQLYGWSDHNPSNDSGWRSPIDAALAGTIRDEFWVFRMDTLRDDQTGERLTRCYIFNLDKGMPKGATANEMMPRGSVTIPLYLPLKRLMSDRTKAN